MPFNSFLFPLFFLSFLGIYYVLPLRARRLWLLVTSCGFYMAAVPRYLLILLALIFIDYVLGLAMESLDGWRRRWVMYLSLLSNLGILFVFKYFDFFSAEISRLIGWLGVAHSPVLLALVLPVGLSFHTFQSLSYIFEVYNRRQRAERDPLTYALYVLFWPQLVAGPIERPQNLLPQLARSHPFSTSNFTLGARWMLFGFVKKVVVADRLANYVDPIFSAPTEYSGIPLLFATYFFTLQIYCDFSGYTDIARGAAKILGIQMMKNFDMPYFAQSIPEFWRRWHISLSTWFRDYIYIPLGGSRVGAGRVALNILIVFTLSGIWHGANWTFVVWGALHGLYLIAARATAKLGPPLAPWLRGLITFHLVAFAWIFFRAGSLADAFYIVTHLFQSSTFPAGAENALGASRIAARGLLIAALLSSEFFSRNGQWESWLMRQPLALRWAAYYAGIALILFAGVLSETRFIYFQF